MSDKPEKKTLKPKKAIVKKEEKPIVKEPEKTPEIIGYKQEGTDLGVEPEEVIETADVEPIVEELTVPQPKTLDEQLLDFYNAAEPGNMSLGHIMVQLGVDDPTLIKQAWDRLYDLRKVPFTKLFKPPLGHIGIE